VVSSKRSWKMSSGVLAGIGESLSVALAGARKQKPAREIASAGQHGHH
jgi:hypothetical protein